MWFWYYTIAVEQTNFRASYKSAISYKITIRIGTQDKPSVKKRLSQSLIIHTHTQQLWKMLFIVEEIVCNVDKFACSI